jgi:acetyl/propionyl-CoA carboxylase alpha subunit
VFTSVLVANRGEIAVRICKTLRRMGIRSVVVASIPDRRSLAVRTADDWVLLEGYSAAESYLDADAVLAAAKEKGCEAIHPGYGFLSERADFAERCAAEGIVFIGPPPEVLRGLGDKSAARRLAVENGVPVVPGWDGADDDATLTAKAAEIGFPVMVKARGGGGGRGMRPVHDPAELPEAIESARREAEAAFGDPGLLLEKLVTNAHHVEVQVVADSHGNVIHLGERDCSVQRRRQKLIEETPSPIVDDALRAELTGAALKLARAVGYVNAGTFEFLVGPSAPRPGGSGSSPSTDIAPSPPTRPYYFLEVNPRLQVEHPVTEMVTGLDLVELQLRIAAGEELPLTQEQVTFSGHAIEFRINAEDPWSDFRPSSGRITRMWQLDDDPRGREDSGYEVGDSVPAQYDSLLKKFITHCETRELAVGHLAYGVGSDDIRGISTNLALAWAIGTNATFAAGEATVDWFESALPELLTAADLAPEAFVAAALGFATRATRYQLHERAAWIGAGASEVWVSDGRLSRAVSLRFSTARQGTATVDLTKCATFELSPPDQFGGFEALVSATRFKVNLDAGSSWDSISGDQNRSTEPTPARHVDIWIGGRSREFELVPPPPLPRRAHAGAEGATAVTAPLAGTIASVRVAEGDAVETGELLLTLDAMKMEHRITATSPGTVASLPVAPGDVVREGDVLVELA